jgi:CheY-specific phosphatase CheX
METEQWLSSAAADVLETTFFSPVMEEAPVSGMPCEGALAARLQFSGARSGAFTVRVTEGAARVIAASFLAEETDEPAPEQVQEVICELSNMMCGAVLSRLDRGAHFDLSTPVLVDPLEVATAQATSRAFDIGDGEVAVYLHLDD